MYDETILDVVRTTLLVTLKIAGPILAAGVVIGLVISVLQSITSIQDQALTFVPKIIGMVLVFDAVATATGASKAQALASGIRVKLFSTAAALMVAIPSLFLFFTFNQRLNAIVAHCEVLCENFLLRIAMNKRRAKAKAAKAERSTESAAVEKKDEALAAKEAVA